MRSITPRWLLHAVLLHLLTVVGSAYAQSIAPTQASKIDDIVLYKAPAHLIFGTRHEEAVAYALTLSHFQGQNPTPEQIVQFYEVTKSDLSAKRSPIDDGMNVLAGGAAIGLGVVGAVATEGALPVILSGASALGGTWQMSQGLYSFVTPDPAATTDKLYSVCRTEAPRFIALGMQNEQVVRPLILHIVTGDATSDGTSLLTDPKYTGPTPLIPRPFDGVLLPILKSEKDRFRSNPRGGTQSLERTVNAVAKLTERTASTSAAIAADDDAVPERRRKEHLQEARDIVSALNSLAILSHVAPAQLADIQRAGAILTDLAGIAFITPGPGAAVGQASLALHILATLFGGKGGTDTALKDELQAIKADLRAVHVELRQINVRLSSIENSVVRIEASLDAIDHTLRQQHAEIIGVLRSQAYTDRERDWSDFDSAIDAYLRGPVADTQRHEDELLRAYNRVLIQSRPDSAGFAHPSFAGTDLCTSSEIDTLLSGGPTQYGQSVNGIRDAVRSPSYLLRAHCVSDDLQTLLGAGVNPSLASQALARRYVTVASGGPILNPGQRRALLQNLRTMAMRESLRSNPEWAGAVPVTVAPLEFYLFIVRASQELARLKEKPGSERLYLECLQHLSTALRPAALSISLAHQPAGRAALVEGYRNSLAHPLEEFHKIGESPYVVAMDHLRAPLELLYETVKFKEVSINGRRLCDYTLNDEENPVMAFQRQTGALMFGTLSPLPHECFWGSQRGTVFLAAEAHAVDAAKGHYDALETSLAQARTQSLKSWDAAVGGGLGGDPLRLRATRESIDATYDHLLVGLRALWPIVAASTRPSGLGDITSAYVQFATATVALVDTAFRDYDKGLAIYMRSQGLGNGAGYGFLADVLRPLLALEMAEQLLTAVSPSGEPSTSEIAIEGSARGSQVYQPLRNTLLAISAGSQMARAPLGVGSERQLADLFLPRLRANTGITWVWGYATQGIAIQRDLYRLTDVPLLSIGSAPELAAFSGAGVADGTASDTINRRLAKAISEVSMSDPVFAYRVAEEMTTTTRPLVGGQNMIALAAIDAYLTLCEEQSVAETEALALSRATRTHEPGENEERPWAGTWSIAGRPAHLEQRGSVVVGELGFSAHCGVVCDDLSAVLIGNVMPDGRLVFAWTGSFESGYGECVMGVGGRTLDGRFEPLSDGGSAEADWQGARAN